MDSIFRQTIIVHKYYYAWINILFLVMSKHIVYLIKIRYILYMKLIDNYYL